MELKKGWKSIFHPFFIFLLASAHHEWDVISFKLKIQN